MYPDPERQFKTESEKRLYFGFKEQLPPDYTVLHGRRWLDTGPSKNPDVECDFIIARPGAAILIVEVKGGRWEHRNGSWCRYGEPILGNEDPIEQANIQKSALIRLLKHAPAWQRTFFPVDYALALPDSDYDARTDSTGFPAILTNSYLNYLREWTETAMRDAVQRNNGTTCTADMIAHLVQCLMRDYFIPLGKALDLDEGALFVLTEEQRMLDTVLARQHRLTIQGCAGSGKTWMAIRHVKRLAALPDVRHILFTCFNLDLAAWLRQETVGLAAKVDTVPFMEFCERHLQHAGLVAVSRDERGPAYWEPLPERMLDVIDQLPYRYDAIVVDEGQIFKPHWWSVLDLLLVDSDQSYRYVFFDDSQRIYSETNNQVPGAAEPFLLSVNVRNTANINRVAGLFMPDHQTSLSNNVPGELVELGLYSDTAGLRRLLRQSLDRLINKGDVAAKDVVILAPRRLEKSPMADAKLGNFRLGAHESSDPGAIRWATIQGYRGMEHKVVILADFERDTGNFEALMYCGASRATTKLFVFLPDSFSSATIAKLRSCCVEVGEK
ncbi:MAG: NERD domain-containing protein [Anaerolineales bacterium]|nr:NERD domain-containing protein [Anaerolineales bacterium]